MALPARNHRIALDAAVALTRQFRSRAPASVRAGAFHADQVRELLAQKGCVALRIYNATNDKGENDFVLVGVDENDKDLTGGILLEFSFLCPPFCGPGSQLDS
jgi:hypothetical protein